MTWASCDYLNYPRGGRLAVPAYSPSTMRPGGYSYRRPDGDFDFAISNLRNWESD